MNENISLRASCHYKLISVHNFPPWPLCPFKPLTHFKKLWLLNLNFQEVRTNTHQSHSSSSCCHSSLPCDPLPSASPHPVSSEENISAGFLLGGFGIVLPLPKQTAELCTHSRETWEKQTKGRARPLGRKDEWELLPGMLDTATAPAGSLGEVTAHV